MKPNMVVVVLGAVVLVGMAMPALANFDLAMRAYEEGDLATAFREFKNDGSAEAQFNVGLMYALGSGVKQDHREAANWYRKSAEQGYQQAQ